ncbi:hypothetical protein SADUNF_Sadunf02G0207100 [Salix dunnii]|uniref:Uncharacterized protein n=1 Tax=Salix dunnii TaxID=1413687 RepID=A0A835N954_9ROSI|nr:hypothetical protein SADUNF_Sadunf02G0207100 [Salix dunnii]
MDVSFGEPRSKSAKQRLKCKCGGIVLNIFYMHVELELHDTEVLLTKQVTASSSKKPLMLDPITPTPIPPSRVHTNIPSQSQTMKHLLFEDDTPLQSSTTDTAVEPPNVIPLLDPDASAMSKDNDPPKKHHCPSKSHDD